MSLVPVLISSGMLATAPTSNIPATASSAATEPLTFVVNVAPGTAAITVAYNWGDGTTGTYNLSNVVNGQIALTHAYESSGTYTLTVVITTNEGATTRTSTVTILA